MLSIVQELANRVNQTETQQYGTTRVFYFFNIPTTARTAVRRPAKTRRTETSPKGGPGLFICVFAAITAPRPPGSLREERQASQG